MTLLHLLSYVGILAAAAFIVLSLASGLLWIAELIEEHSRLSKVIGTRAIYVIIALHALLYLFDTLPLLQILFSVVCHIVYLQNFSYTWPFISLTSLTFLGSCVLAIANHFLWFFHFSARSREARQRAHRTFRGGTGSGESAPGFADVATFFALCVWLVPLFLFLSLSANDNALPTMSANGLPTEPAPFTPTQPITTSRSSLFKAILDFFPRISQRRNSAEGIIVSHTPTPSAPSSPYATTFGHGHFAPGPQLSPRPSLSGSDSTFPRTSDELMGRARITLRPPPKRSVTGPALSSTPRWSSDEVSVGHHSSLNVPRATVAPSSPVRRRS